MRTPHSVKVTEIELSNYCNHKIMVIRSFIKTYCRSTTLVQSMEYSIFKYEMIIVGVMSHRF